MLDLLYLCLTLLFFASAVGLARGCEALQHEEQ